MGGRWRGVALLVLGIGCGPSAARHDDGATTTSGDASATASSTTFATTASTTTTSTSSSTTSSTDTGTSTSETSSSSDGADESTGGPPPSVCDPQPEDVGARLNIDPEDDEGTALVDASCSITALSMPYPETQRIEMECGEQNGSTLRVIEYSAHPFIAIPIDVGDTVGLRSAEVVPIDNGGYEFVALRDANDELIAAMYGRLDPPDQVDEASWFAPFTFTLRTDVCDVDPYDPPGGAFIIDPCAGPVMRGAYEFALTDESLLVYDQTAASFGAYELIVPWAAVYYPIDRLCWGPGSSFTEARFVVVRPA
jgi:hypothetical protein